MFRNFERRARGANGGSHDRIGIILFCGHEEIWRKSPERSRIPCAGTKATLPRQMWRWTVPCRRGNCVEWAPD